MLSNTAERKPKPSVVLEDAKGNFSTGIIEAINTSESRKIEPRKALGSTSQSGRRIPAEPTIATHTATPINGKWSPCPVNFTFTITLVARASPRIRPTMPIRIQSTPGYSWTSPKMGEYLCCLIAAGIPKTNNATDEALIAWNTWIGETPAIHIIVVVVSPITLQAPPALIGGDVIEKTGKNPHHHQ